MEQNCGVVVTWNTIGWEWQSLICSVSCASKTGTKLWKMLNMSMPDDTPQKLFLRATLGQSWDK
eukprot:4467581-Karenia_brevis.AAC.1